MIGYTRKIIPFESELPLPPFYSRMAPTTSADNESRVIEQIGIEHSPSIHHDNTFLVIQIPETLGLSHFCKTSSRYRSRNEAFRHPLLLTSKANSLHPVLERVQMACLLQLLSLKEWGSAIFNSLKARPELTLLLEVSADIQETSVTAFLKSPVSGAALNPDYS